MREIKYKAYLKQFDEIVDVLAMSWTNRGIQILVDCKYNKDKTIYCMGGCTESFFPEEYDLIDCTYERN